MAGASVLAKINPFRDRSQNIIIKKRDSNPLPALEVQRYTDRAYQTLESTRFHEYPNGTNENRLFFDFQTSQVSLGYLLKLMSVLFKKYATAKMISSISNKTSD